MRRIVSFWIIEGDGPLVAWIRAFGVRNVARAAGFKDASHISKWLRGHCGMGEDKVQKILSLKIKVKK